MAKSTAVLKEVPKVMSIGDMIDRMEDIRKERKVLADKDKPLKEEYDQLKLDIIEILDKNNSLTASSERASVKINKTTVPVVKEVEKLLPYIVKNKLWHLILAQPLTTPAWREAVGMKGMDLPGTETFVKRDLGHSSLKQV
jgi:hypothetical protein